MKKLLIALVLVFAAAGLRAQTGQQILNLEKRQGTAGYEDMPVIEDLKLFEFEMGVGINFTRRWEGLKSRPGTNLNFELRMNRPEPWDIALQFRGANFVHDAGEGGKIKTTVLSPSIFVDYNRRLNRRTTFFAGVGFGGNFAQNDAVIPLGVNAGIVFNHGTQAFSVTPRIGASVFNCLRITAEYTITARDYSRFGLNLGFTFGGSYKSPYVDRRDGKQKFWEDIAPAIINSLVP